MIFLDHNSTSPLLPQAFEEMKKYSTNFFYNPSGEHIQCAKIKDDIENARKYISKQISSNDGLLVFTSSATEANNFIMKQQFFDSVITSQIEHPSIIESAKYYHNTKFVHLDNDGVIDLNNLEELLKKTVVKTLVSIQHGNQVVHTIQPIKKIRNLCNKYKALLHVDATQTFGKMSINNLNADFITISAHKCYGPKGIGGIWIANDHIKEVSPLLYGGHQEMGLRASTYNAPCIMGFKTALEYMITHQEENREKITKLTNIFRNKIENGFSNIILNGSKEHRLIGGLHYSIPGVDMRSVLLQLDNIILSTGMSCSTDVSDPVLTALNKNDFIRNSFRMQIGFENTEEEILTAEEKLESKIKESLSIWGIL